MSNIEIYDSGLGSFGSGVIHLFADHRQVRLVEDSSYRVSHLAHYDPGTAGLDVDTLVALAKAGFAGTRQGRERSLNRPDHGAKRDLFRWLCQHIAPTLAFLAGHEADTLKR